MKYREIIFGCLKELGREINCDVCKSEDKLHIHHIDINPNNNKPSNLQLLCLKCHSHLHYLIKQKKRTKQTKMKELVKKYKIPIPKKIKQRYT